MSDVLSELRSCGIPSGYLESRGRQWCKIHTDAAQDLQSRQPFYVAVTGMNPTPFGEGKTFTTLALSGAFRLKKKRAASSIRQPSFGVALGKKGAGLGAGKVKVDFEKEVIYNYNTDSLKVNLVQNLIAALADNLVFFGKKGARQNIIPRSSVVCDRVLRSFESRLGKRRFIIAEASEVMAILSLARDTEDMRKRLSKIILCRRKDGSFIFLKEFKCIKFLQFLLKEAFMPNVFLTRGRGIVFIHTGPFANISTGNSSVVADIVASRFFDYVITESGFGTESGFEKLVHIKSHSSGMYPNLAVLVCSVRATKYHSGKYGIPPQIDSSIYRKNMKNLKKGISNLKKHIHNLKLFDIPCIVVINRFRTDSAQEIDFLVREAKECGSGGVFVNDAFSRGEKDLIGVVEAIESFKKRKRQARPLFRKNLPFREKIDIICDKLYSAKKVIYAPQVRETLRDIEKHNFGYHDVCIAKTQFSLSGYSHLLGSPDNFDFNINGLGMYNGAGFIYARSKNLNLLPGMPRDSVLYRIDRYL